LDIVSFPAEASVRALMVFGRTYRKSDLVAQGDAAGMGGAAALNRQSAKCTFKIRAIMPQDFGVGS
jgi:hypothetical protein